MISVRRDGVRGSRASSSPALPVIWKMYNQDKFHRKYVHKKKHTCNVKVFL